jgi:hypothetical protein
MKLNTLTIGQRLGLLASLLLLATLFIGLRGLAINSNSLTQNEQIMTMEQTITESIDTARHAQVQFKIQVQEWKNTLLRGAQGQAAFDKYRTAFTRESQNTQALLTHLSELLPKIGMDNRQVLATRDIHAGLEQKYLTALNDYQVGDVTSAQRVDKQVTGIDREPTKMIDDVVTQTLKHAKTLHQQTIAQNQARYQETRWMLLLAMALTLAAGLLVTWWLIRSITRPLAQAVSIARTVAAGDLQSLIGLAVIIGLEKLKVPGGILLTIIGVSIVGLIFDPTVHFSGIFAMPSLSDDKGNSLIGSLDIVGALNPVILPSVLALVMTAVFDATGTIRAVAG